MQQWEPSTQKKKEKNDRRKKEKNSNPTCMQFELPRKNMDEFKQQSENVQCPEPISVLEL